MNNKIILIVEEIIDVKKEILVKQNAFIAADKGASK